MRLSLGFSILLVLASPAAAASGPAVPTEREVAQIETDNSGRGLAIAGGQVFAVGADGRLGAAGAELPEGEADISVAPGGRVAVVAEDREAGTIALGFGTTQSPPQTLAHFADGYFPQVAVADDGRLLIVYTAGGGVHAARFAPGAPTPQVTRLTEPLPPGFIGGYSSEGATITAAGTPLATIYRSQKATAGTYMLSRATTPDGPFGPLYGTGLSPRLGQTRALDILPERTGYVTGFRLEQISEMKTALRLLRVAPDGEVEVQTVKRPDAFGGAVGANGGAAVVFSRNRVLWLRRRTESGRWERPVPFAPGDGKPDPAVAVSGKARIHAAFVTRDGISAVTQRAGREVPGAAPVAGTGGCKEPAISGAPSGRALLLVDCPGGQRIAPLR